MDPEIKKQTLRLITYGLYVLTAADGDEMAAGTINWLSQASFEPPLVMLGVRKDSHTYTLIERTGLLAVNILGAGQQEIAQAFFRPSQVEGDRINGYPFEKGPRSGAPLLTDLPAWFEAHRTSTVEGGDHTIFIAEVIDAGLRDPQARPLAMGDTGWYYGG